MRHEFIFAIRHKKKVFLTFYSKAQGCHVRHPCAPLDCGPVRGAPDRAERLHFWDYAAGTGQHLMSLLPDQVVQIEVLHDSFEPAEIVTWDVKEAPWFVSRDWGACS